MNMFLVGQVSLFGENFDIGIFSDSIHVINVKCCKVVLFLELYLFVVFFFFFVGVFFSFYPWLKNRPRWHGCS